MDFKKNLKEVFLDKLFSSICHNSQPLTPSQHLKIKSYVKLLQS